MDSRKRTPKTPPINTSGVFLAYEPFTLSTSVIYKCTAIRNFEDLQSDNIDVFNSYYKPFGLDLTVYREDAAIDAAILTLEAADGSERYIPNTFIKSYPGGNGLAYVNKVLVVELGLMLGDVDTGFLEPLMIDMVKQHIGVETEVKTVAVPYIGAVTHETGVAMERARVGAIRSNKTIYQQLQEQTALAAALRAQNDELLLLLASKQT